MSISVNDSGTIRTLSTVHANENGTLRALNTIHANENGVLRKIHEYIPPLSSVSISGPSSGYVGDTVYFNFSIYPSNASWVKQSWSTSDSSVVSLRGAIGTITGAGTATIKVSLTDSYGNVRSSSMKVNGVQKLTGISVSPSSVRLSPGSSYQLSVNAVPSGAVLPTISWSRADQYSITVSGSGLVTVRNTTSACGDKTVTASGGGYTSTCIVKVRAPDKSWSNDVTCFDSDFEKRSLSSGHERHVVYINSIEQKDLYGDTGSVSLSSLRCSLTCVNSSNSYTTLKVGSGYTFYTSSLTSESILYFRVTSFAVEASHVATTISYTIYSYGE